MERTYNSKGNMYWCEGIGNTWFEIWEKNCTGWKLRCWFSDVEKGLKYWEEIKDEPIQDYRLPWIEWIMDSDYFVI